MAVITTVVFDMYETLVENTTDLWIDTFRVICETQGLTVDHQVLFREWKTLETTFREDRLNLDEPENSPPFMTYEQAWRDCFVQTFAKLGLEGDAMAASRKAVVDLGCRRPYWDVVEALPVIQAGWRTGVLSNADDDYLFPLIESVGWEFQAVLSSEMARAYKPLPSPFLRIIEMLGVAPGEVLYVGDNLYDDILGAQSVGIRAAWLNRFGKPHDPMYPKPDYELRSLMELPDVLNGTLAESSG